MNKKNQDKVHDIIACNSRGLSQRNKLFTVGELEHALLRRWPRETAESWDKTGLIVGCKTDLVSGLAIALDPTISAVQAAKQAGANVLLTHHPVFLKAPETFQPAQTGTISDGSVVWEAIRQNVALMNFHTALDVSRDAQIILPSMLGLKFKSILQPLRQAKNLGYGQVCNIAETEEALTLEQLSARCVSVFSRVPRVWGSFSRPIKTVVTATGSAGNLVEDCLSAGVDCLICGEVKYHSALDAQQAGLCIIDLGHDTSELPLCSALLKGALAVGVPDQKVVVFEQNYNWQTPEAYRL